MIAVIKRYTVLLLFLVILAAGICHAAGVRTYYPLTYSDDFEGGISIIMPSTYSEGQPIKWIVYLHPYNPDSGSGTGDTNQDYLKGLVDTYNIALVTIDSRIDTPWMDTIVRPCSHLAEGIAYAKTKHNFNHYLPCLYGWSAGSMALFHEWKRAPYAYSCFAASSILTDIFADFSGAGIDLDDLWGDVFGGTRTSTPTVIARWTEWSATDSLVGASLGNRKIKIIHGASDNVTVPNVQYTPFIEGVLPAANLHSTTMVTGAGHTCFMIDPAYQTTYAPILFGYFADHSVVATAITGCTITGGGTW